MSEESISPTTIVQLCAEEEALRAATEEAQLDYVAGRTTEAVFEDLQTRYFLAKQAREDMEGK